MPAIELINALALSFLLSEFLRPNTERSKKLLRAVAASLLVANVVLHAKTAIFISAASTSAAAAVLFLASVIHSTFDLLAAPAGAAVALLGRDAIISAVVALVVTLTVVGWSARVNKSVNRVVICASSVSMGALLFAVLKWLEWGSPAEVAGAHPEAVRVCVGMGCFTVMCYADIRRDQPNISGSAFFRSIALAAAYCLPVLPWLAVAVSTVLFLIISLLDLVRIDTAFLGPVVYVLTIYGPFAAIYIETKRRACSAQYMTLPGASWRSNRR